MSEKPRQGVGVYLHAERLRVPAGSTQTYRRPSEVLVRSGRASALKVVDCSEQHVFVFRPNHSLHDIELAAAPVAAHASTVAPVLRSAQHLWRRVKENVGEVAKNNAANVCVGSNTAVDCLFVFERRWTI